MSETMVTFFWEGESAEMRERYDRVLKHVVEVSPARPIIHLASVVDGGFRVIDVWTDEEVARRMLDNPEFHQKLEEFGLGHRDVQVAPVHQMGWPTSASPMYR